MLNTLRSLFRSPQPAPVPAIPAADQLPAEWAMTDGARRRKAGPGSLAALTTTTDKDGRQSLVLILYVPLLDQLGWRAGDDVLLLVDPRGVYVGCRRAVGPGTRKLTPGYRAKGAPVERVHCNTRCPIRPDHPLYGLPYTPFDATQLSATADGIVLALPRLDGQHG